MTSLRPALVSLTLAFLLAACSLFETNQQAGLPFSQEQIEFNTEHQSYQRSEKLTLYLANRSARRVYYNLCHSTLERFIEGHWVIVAAPKADSTTCTDHLAGLGAGQTVTYQWGGLREDLPEGLYRFRDTIERDVDYVRYEIKTNAFSLVE